MQQQKAIRKTFSTTIKKADLDKKYETIQPPITKEDKLKLAKSILDIPTNFEDEIDVIIQTDEIFFKWQPSIIEDRAEVLHKNALLLARKGNLDEAIEKWTEATLINSLDPDYFFNLGIAYFEKKKYQDAIENLSRVIAICPLYLKAHLILGTAFLKIRKFEFAKKHLKRFVKFDNSNSLAYLNLGAVNSVLKEYEEGIAMFERAIALSPKEPRAYLGSAKLYSTIGNIEKANAYFRKVIDLDNKGNLANYAKRSIVASEAKNNETKEAKTDEIKGNPEEYYSEGYHYYVSGDYAKSASMYKKYLSIKPKDDYVWYALGEVQLRGGRPELALTSFKNAITLYPEKGLYFKELAIIFDKLNKPSKVITAILKAKELGKTDSITYCLWGKALYQLGNFEEAISKLENSLKSNRNNFLAKYYLAETLIKNDEIQEAIDYLHELKEVKIDTPLKKKAEILYEKLIQGE